MHSLIYVLLFLTSVACGQTNNSTPVSENTLSNLSKTKVDTPSLQFTESQYLDLGEKYSNQGKYAEAVKLFSDIIRVNPNNLRAYLKRATCYQEMAFFSKAIKDLTFVLKKDKDNPLAYNNLGSVFFDKKAPLKAIEYLNKAIKISPNYSRAYYNRGYVYNDLGKKDKACADWKKGGDLGDFDCKEMLAKYCK